MSGGYEVKRLLRIALGLGALCVFSNNCIAPHASAQALPLLQGVDEQNVQLAINNLEGLLQTLGSRQNVSVTLPIGEGPKPETKKLITEQQLAKYKEVLENLKKKFKAKNIHRREEPRQPALVAVCRLSDRADMA